MVEFLGYRFAFNADDFEERVTSAAVKLGLVESNDLDEDEVEDLVELAADGRIDEPRSSLGRYLVRHWEQLSLVKGESLVYWLRKLVFRGAWLDHRVEGGTARRGLGRAGGRVRLPRSPRRPRPARARAGAVVARSPVQKVVMRISVAMAIAVAFGAGACSGDDREERLPRMANASMEPTIHCAEPAQGCTADDADRLRPAEGRFPRKGVRHRVPHSARRAGLRRRARRRLRQSDRRFAGRDVGRKGGLHLHRRTPPQRALRGCGATRPRHNSDTKHSGRALPRTRR